MAPGAHIGASQLEAQAGLVVTKRNGRVTGVIAAEGGLLISDDATRDPGERARAFLASYGSVIGLDADERNVVPFAARVAFKDATGDHVRLDQTYRGLPVFGGELIVHMNADGITGVNGKWLDGLNVPVAPAIDEAYAHSVAIAAAAKLAKPASLAELAATTAELAVFRSGLVENRRTHDHLAWAFEVGGGAERFQIWVDATDGASLATYPLNHTAKFRVAYAGSFTDDVSQTPYQPGATAVCREDGVPNGGLQCVAAPADLFRFSGQVYDMFSQGFARDSYDGLGIKMKTVNLINQNCPNAYWDGQTTNYCPDFELDDVVAHEWGHAYTQFTHNLVYAYQSGALNEAYSDMWGETVDLLNGEDGLGGGMNAEPAPTGVRWAMGEDFATGSGEYELLLRDMWDPDRLGYPGKVTSPNYTCGTGDGGGVHSNSGVPNHAYALLVDGTNFPASCTAAPNNCRAPLTCNAATSKCEFNGQSITKLDFTKTAAIYFRAMTTKQTTTSDFVDHADALELSCMELVGMTPDKFLAGPVATAITATDCDQVKKAMLAVEMRTPPNCGFEPLLQPNPPAACRGATATRSETWANGIAAWTKSFQLGSTGDSPTPYYEWAGVNTKPGNEPGKAAFAVNSKTGTCAPAGDESGVYMLASPAITAPGTDHTIELRFRHFVETELLFDGGQLSISINGGAFTLVPRAAYVHNAPNSNLDAAVPVGQNTNPRAGQPAWTGADEGSTTGSWGTTVVNLSGLVQPGQTYKLRFDFSVDGCNGVTGWYIGDLVVNDCPPLTAPVLRAGADYEDPDTNGQFTLAWDPRPAGASGPDKLQQSTESCLAALDENCNGNFNKWLRAADGLATWSSGPKPAHATNTFRVVGVDGTFDESTTLTTMAGITIPAGSTAKLTWQEWFVNEPDDAGFVEVSDGATCTTAGPNEADCGLNSDQTPKLCEAAQCWTQVYKTDRALEAGPADEAFATEDLALQRVNMTPFVGKTIRVRFRYFVGGLEHFFYKQMGWYLDNIRLDVDNWTTINNANVTTTLISGKANGDYCYRVATTYQIGGNAVESNFSNILPITVAQQPAPADTDQDTIVDTSDNCITTPNTDQSDADGDGVGTACDACFGAPNVDGDTDKICDAVDNCAAVPNPTQADADGDGKGDACDCAVGEDMDDDLVCNAGDNCPNVANTDQVDDDGDGIGNACDVCAGSLNIDTDADKICDDVDNCAAVGNPGQEDTDGDTVGDECDCVAANDEDGDGACNATDNCPTVENATQADSDRDGVGDKCDNCATTANPDQADADLDEIGDICELAKCDDADADGICDDDDSCPDVSNPDQRGACFVDDGGCGCATNNVGPGGVAPWLLVAFAVVRRRSRRSKSVMAAAVALVCMLAFTRAADADETQTRHVAVQLGGFVGGFIPSNDHEFYDYMSTTQVPMGSIAPGFGVRAALFPLPFLGIEVDGTLMRSSLDGRDSVNLFGFGAHLIGQLPGKIRPFGLVGVGGMGLQSNDDVLGSDVDAIGYAGLGVAIDVAKNIALRGDGRILRAPAAEVETGTDHFSFSVGVSGVFDLRSTKKIVVIREEPPPNPDPDGDGIIGASDSCPEKPENVNRWQDEDGCPDEIPDTDSDGLNDVADKCREQPEDVDKFTDEDGCPDPDNDGDGALDAVDRCPIVVGPIENSGCPDTDRDTDTVVDRLDNCPDEAGKVKNHGCKDKQLVIITPTKLTILEILYFQNNSAKLLPRSNKLLDQVAKVLVAHPEIAKIRIEGHTDDRGDDQYNLDLSQQRAESVQAYLIKKGVGASRIEAKGYGESVPLDPEQTAEGRAANRRVEFKIANATP